MPASAKMVPPGFSAIALLEVIPVSISSVPPVNLVIRSPDLSLLTAG